VVGVNLSAQHISFASEWAKRENLEDRVRFINCDYRNIEEYTFEKYDKIVSVGLLEHVGKKNKHEYFRTVKNLLKRDGLSLLHTITTSDRSNAEMEPFISKYIFPGGYLHHQDNIVAEISQQGLTILHVHEFGLNYAKTLIEWNKNVQNSKVFKEMSPEFQKMWTYNLLSSAGAFFCQHIFLHQTVFSKKSMEYTYL
jgi:cyclopropane-fatty-acyl-phospholipid synthase